MDDSSDGSYRTLTDVTFTGDGRVIDHIAERAQQEAAQLRYLQAKIDSEALARELAESDPTVAGIDGYGECAYCSRQVSDPRPHLPTCLWLRARKMAGMEAS